MEHSKNLTIEKLEKARQRWLKRMYNLAEVKKQSQGQKLLNLALLEKAVPALMIDRSLLQHNTETEKIITIAARNELKRLIDKCK